MGHEFEATAFYKRLVSLLSDKWKEQIMLLCHLTGSNVACLFAYFILPFNVFKKHDPQRGITSYVIQLNLIQSEHIDILTSV